MRKLLLSALAMAGCLTAGAQSTMTLHLGASPATFSLDNVSKITFADNGNINVFDALGGSESFALDKVSKITFAGDFTAIGDVKAQPKAQLAFGYDGYSVRVSGLAAPAVARLTNAAGAQIALATVADGGRIDVSSLQKGVYVVSVDGVAFKFVK